MPDLTLNNPLVRQDLLKTRLKSGEQLVAMDLANEFGISLDTIRRDLLALEDRGLVQRVRGGAIPVRSHSSRFTERQVGRRGDYSSIVRAALPLIKQGMTIILGWRHDLDAFGRFAGTARQSVCHYAVTGNRLDYAGKRHRYPAYRWQAQSMGWLCRWP